MEGHQVLTFTAEQLRAVGKAIFAAAGAPDDVATHVANSLVGSNLAGHDSHGILRIPMYVDGIRASTLVPGARPTILNETPTTALVKGNWAFGQISATFCVEQGIVKARESHVAAVALVQSNHIGRLGEYAEVAARAGFVSMTVVAGMGLPGAAAPYGGARRALSTNPYAFGTPAEKHAPMVVDVATTTVAEGKLRVARAKRAPVPEGWIIDKDGKPTTNAEDFYNGGMLLPFGGHKGYGLSMMAEIFGGQIPGVDEYREGKRGAGAFFLVIDPGVFRPLQSFLGGVDDFFDVVKDVPPAPGFDEVLIPGEPEQRSRAQREAEGIPVAEDTWAALGKYAAELGVDLAAVAGVK